jgi:hypothetical protein
MKRRKELALLLVCVFRFQNVGKQVACSSAPTKVVVMRCASVPEGLGYQQVSSDQSLQNNSL